MNEIMVEGEIIKTGATPLLVTHCGFRSPAEVRRAAARFSQGEPCMRMDDVAELFRNTVKQVG